ncbi:hypothetical protein RYX36_005989 [Vicia faba]
MSSGLGNATPSSGPKTVGRWLKERREKKKEENISHNAQVHAAEAMGAEREHLTSVVSSAVNVRSYDDITTLTAATATGIGTTAQFNTIHRFRKPVKSKFQGMHHWNYRF